MRSALFTVFTVITLTGCCTSYIKGDLTIDMPSVTGTLGNKILTNVGVSARAIKVQHPKANDDAIKFDLAQQAICHQLKDMPDGPEKERTRAEYLTTLLKILNEGIKSGGGTAINLTTTSPGFYGYANSQNIQRDVELMQKCGPFRRVVASGDFNSLCKSIQLKCEDVCDWEGYKQLCNENPGDGSRVAYCQSP